MKTLKSEWLETAKGTVPLGASKQQVLDMENLFYCGAVSVILILVGDTALSAEEMKENFKTIYDDISDYKESLATSHTDSD